MQIIKNQIETLSFIHLNVPQMLFESFPQRYTVGNAIYKSAYFDKIKKRVCNVKKLFLNAKKSLPFKLQSS